MSQRPPSLMDCVSFIEPPLSKAIGRYGRIAVKVGRTLGRKLKRIPRKIAVKAGKAQRAIGHKWAERVGVGSKARMAMEQAASKTGSGLRTRGAFRGGKVARHRLAQIGARAQGRQVVRGAAIGAVGAGAAYGAGEVDRPKRKRKEDTEGNEMLRRKLRMLAAKAKNLPEDSPFVRELRRFKRKILERKKKINEDNEGKADDGSALLGDKDFNKDRHEGNEPYGKPHMSVQMTQGTGSGKMLGRRFFNAHPESRTALNKPLRVKKSLAVRLLKQMVDDEPITEREKRIKEKKTKASIADKDRIVYKSYPGYPKGHPSYKVLKKNKVALEPEERKLVMKRGATWNHGPNGEKTSAVWKSVVNGKTYYITDTHRAWNVTKTLKGTIRRYHDFIKRTA